MASLHFVSWNCMSCYPQYYDEIQAIEQGASEKRLQMNRPYNIQRFQNIVERLLPFLQQLNEKALLAITLQEVDFELLDLLKERIQTEFPQLYIHHRTPYMIYPPNSPHPHQFAYYLATIHHRHNRRYTTAHETIQKNLSRCLVTALKQMVIYNAHIPWVGQDHGDYRKARTRQTIQTLARALRKHPNGILIGDLNASCEFNDTLYKTCFATTFYNTYIFGESYKLSPENVLHRKTYQSLDHTPDDGCIVHKKYTISSYFDSLRRENIPVNAKGWLLKKQKTTYPSDHALVRVKCEPKIKKHITLKNVAKKPKSKHIYTTASNHNKYQSKKLFTPI